MNARKVSVLCCMKFGVEADTIWKLREMIAARRLEHVMLRMT